MLSRLPPDAAPASRDRLSEGARRIRLQPGGRAQAGLREGRRAVWSLRCRYRRASTLNYSDVGNGIVSDLLDAVSSRPSKLIHGTTSLRQLRRLSGLCISRTGAVLAAAALGQRAGEPAPQRRTSEPLSPARAARNGASLRVRIDPGLCRGKDRMVTAAITAKPRGCSPRRRCSQAPRGRRPRKKTRLQPFGAGHPWRCLP